MADETPLVSVVTPVYKSEDILARAVGGLLAQDLREWEALFIDDGSPESCWRVVQAYSWIDPRIRTRRQAHAGACVARNRGIAESRGKYLVFLDADDWMEPDALRTMAAACETNGWAAAYGRLRYVTPEGNPTQWQGGFTQGVDLFEAISGSNVLSVPSSVIVRRDVFDQIGAFDPTLVHCGDWDLWARLARLDAPIGFVDQIITNYRMRPGSLSRSPRTLLRDAITTLRRIHLPDTRVSRPRPECAEGADRNRLLSRICHFTVYAAALAICNGGMKAAEPVLDVVNEWAGLSAQRAGEFVFYALCFAHCCGPEGVAGFWTDVVEPLHQLLPELERRTATPGLAGQMFDAMETCCDISLASLPLPLPSPEPLAPKRVARNVMLSSGDTLAHSALRLLAAQEGA
ncbi:MAG TPA: glycosyltransferase [Tepidisphaeraceae bacterium]|nr:glycosyltransferase [Tepidisphaeraceae bacterium]